METDLLATTVSACCRVTRFSRLNIAHFLFFFSCFVGLDILWLTGEAAAGLRKYDGCAVIDSLQSQWVSERVVPTHSIPRRVRLLCATHAACYYNYSNESRLQLFRANIAHTHFITKYLKTKLYNYAHNILFFAWPNAFKFSLYIHCHFDQQLFNVNHKYNEMP